MDPNSNPTADGRHALTKDLPKVCPWCHSTFYTYQGREHPRQPHQVDPEPPIVGGISMGMRETCGHPRCWDAENNHQKERSPRYQSACLSYFAPKDEPSQQKEAKLKCSTGGLKRIGDK